MRKQGVPQPVGVLLGQLAPGSLPRQGLGGEFTQQDFRYRVEEASWSLKYR
jgi:hypothetical protein